MRASHRSRRENGAENRCFVRLLAAVLLLPSIAFSTDPAGEEAPEPAGWAQFGDSWKPVYVPGDATEQPSFGQGAWGWMPDPRRIARAGFEWWEVGYPESASPQQYRQLMQMGVRPFAYINMSEVTPDLLASASRFGRIPIIGYNSRWNTQIVDVRSETWRRWLLARAKEAYDRGARGIKWDVAEVEVQHAGDREAAQQAVDAMVEVLRALKHQHPDVKFLVNQGFAIANAAPDVVDAIEHESLLSLRARSTGLRRWSDGEIAKLDALHERYNMPVILLEYADPYSGWARQMASDIRDMGFVPYIGSPRFDVPGLGLTTGPGW